MPGTPSLAWTRIVTVSAALVAAGCGTRVSFTPLNRPPGPMSPRSTEAVAVFTTARPDRPYVEVGVFEAQQESQFSTADETEVMAEMRAAASERGCDALVMTGSADSVVGSGAASNGSGSFSVSTLRGFRGTCIVYKGPVAKADSPKAQCVPGATQQCTGPGGCSGGQACNAAGSGYSACDCGSSQGPRND